MTIALQQINHFHVWAKTIDGAEYINTLHDHEVDASLAFIGLVKQITKGNVPNEDITIEGIMQTLDEGRRGTYAGYPGLIMVVSKCDGGCLSPTWN